MTKYYYNDFDNNDYDDGYDDGYDDDDCSILSVLDSLTSLPSYKPLLVEPRCERIKMCIVAPKPVKLLADYTDPVMVVLNKPKEVVCVEPEEQGPKNWCKIASS